MELSSATLNSSVCCLASISVVSTVKGLKIGRGIVLMFGQEPGTTKPWLSALNANSRVEVVRKGSAEGILPSRLR